MKQLIWLIFIPLLSCTPPGDHQKGLADLSGEWQFALDPQNKGITERWFLDDLDDTVVLPGTTDSNHKGILNKDTTTMHLNRVYRFEGPAWYRKTVSVPHQYDGKRIVLTLERTKSSRVWVDSAFVGSSALLQSPQEYDLTEFLTPGEHVITLRIDNDLKLTPYGNVHIYTDETQTNWNGVIGKLFLEARPLTQISALKVYPDINRRKIDVTMGIENPTHIEEVDIEWYVERTFEGKTVRLKSMKTRLPCDSEVQLSYELGEECLLWDEFKQPLYRLTVSISYNNQTDTRSTTFGMRHFSTRGTRFTINGRPVFLRGKNDAAVFPITGYTPMESAPWERIFRIARSYGINHYRFHSYCPPEAAFEAADLVGMYLQVELPFWGGLDSDTIADALRAEGFAMLRNYGNHPSFVMFSQGNEIWSGYDRVEKNIRAFREVDNRPLYTMGSNNGIGYVGPRKSSDYFLAARTPYEHDTVLTHTRLTHAFADSRNGGILNTRVPSTEINFDYPVSRISMPLISHEIGQYQIYPDYSEIEKYTGVVRAWNLEVFRKSLVSRGMAGMDSIFQQASGAWSAQCYKAEMEAALRTDGLAGFQLLDLQDFPGQGTALVGILDALMESKGVIDPAVWKQSCNEVVVLLEFPKYCYKTHEPFKASVVVANFSEGELPHPVHWEVLHHSGEALLTGTFEGTIIPQGGNTTIGEFEVDLSSVNAPEQLTVQCLIEGTPYSNSYPLWVYPDEASGSALSDLPLKLPETFQTAGGQDILISRKLDAAALEKLNNGETVLLFPLKEDIEQQSVPGLFPPDFWNYGMFKGISESNHRPVSPGTLGLLIPTDHPIFQDFPTDFHTSWQWFSVIKASRSIILDATGPEFRPIVQVIDNMERNHKMGMIFECLVGTGKLLVCTSRLPDITDQPEAAQL
ncbi:MAG: sugar-binding domain-containing protein, partial [Bacteroidales bacterium]